MSVFGDLLEMAAPVLLKALETFADSYVEGSSLNKDQKQLIYSAYVLINVWGDDLVESTENTYDNAALEVLSAFAKDTLEEAGIGVPLIPDELLEAPPADNE